MGVRSGDRYITLPARDVLYPKYDGSVEPHNVAVALDLLGDVLRVLDLSGGTYSDGISMDAPYRLARRALTSALRMAHPDVDPEDVIEGVVDSGEAISWAVQRVRQLAAEPAENLD